MTTTVDPKTMQVCDSFYVECKFFIVLILTYDDEYLAVMTKSVESQMQVSEMRFLRKIKGVTQFLTKFIILRFEKSLTRSR